MPLDLLPPTAVEGDELVFRRADPQHALDGVSVWCDLDLGADLAMQQVPGGWELRLPRPDLDCLEYLLEPAGGSPETDPANPLRIDGAFGEHSWLPFPGYAAPAWLDEPVTAGTLTPVELEDTAVGRIDAAVWEPADAGGALPLLLAHDGPEMDRFAHLTRFVATGIVAGRLPVMRVALLSPGARNERYAANPAYAAALVDDVLPTLLERWPSDHRPVLSGQSLGALAALHAAWTSADTFGGLFLQSGSFFTAELDPQESGFEFWGEVTGFVASLLDASAAAPGAPRTTLTCGTAEENLANNRLLAEHLRATGVDVAWGEARQGHTWTCWRDLLDPHLTDLLRTVWA